MPLATEPAAEVERLVTSVNAWSGKLAALRDALVGGSVAMQLFFARIALAAKLLGLDRPMLRTKLRLLGLDD